LVKYDYSLDVGQSIETDEKIKQKEQPQGCCPAPEPEEEPKKETTEEPVEEEQLAEVPEEKKEEPVPEEKEENVEIKPISFEKAKLISDYSDEEKPEPEIQVFKEEKTAEPEKEEIQEDEEEPEKDPEEDEKDVNEFLEESFSRESKNYAQYQKNNNVEVYEAEKKKSRFPLIILVVLICAAAFGYGYAVFKEPAQTGAVTAPQINNLTPIIEPNITKPIIKTKPAESKPNKSIDFAIEQLTSALKD